MGKINVALMAMLGNYTLRDRLKRPKAWACLKLLIEKRKTWKQPVRIVVLEVKDKYGAKYENALIRYISLVDLKNFVLQCSQLDYIPLEKVNKKPVKLHVYRQDLWKKYSRRPEKFWLKLKEPMPLHDQKHEDKYEVVKGIRRL